MDRELFLSVIRNLTHANVFCYTGASEDLQAFEQKYCFHPTLQPMFRSDALEYLMRSVSDNVFYEIADSFHLSLLFFRYAGGICFVGPYARREFDEKLVQRLMVENNIPASYLLSFKLYYTALPMQSSMLLQNHIFDIMKAFTPDGADFQFRRLRGFQEEKRPERDYSSEFFDYAEIYKRYENENRLLSAIENGNTEEALVFFSAMEYKPPKTALLTTSKGIYENPLMALAMLRTLIRKAAERGGLSVLKIDEITQHYAQQAATLRNAKDLAALNQKMIIELTDAVRESQSNEKHYSPPIRKVTEYINLNLSQNISTEYLAKLVHFSDSYLSKEFKRETGKTIGDYIAGLRCNKAASLLLDTEMSVQEISAFVGYPDNNYFTKVFKKHLGSTPSAYRIHNR